MAVEIHEIGGNCPVQAEGLIDGEAFYFRARGSYWNVSIGGDDPVANEEWSYGESFGVLPDAGWMSIEQATAFIHKAADLYAASKASA